MHEVKLQKMAKASGRSHKGTDVDISKIVSDFVDRLSNEHRLLVVLKAQLYDGSWITMLDDLRNRLAGKPYIFKLANRIEEDIKRIEEMQKFESEHNIDLADHVQMP
jgi:hypothetical protein